jgi:hypothetical protein
MATNAVLLQAIVAAYDIPELAAEGLSLSCIAPLTFLAYRFWGFHEEDEGMRLEPATATAQPWAGTD